MNNTTPDDIKLARQEFLERTSFRTPVDAVESGAPKLEDWCDLVSNHRLKFRCQEAAATMPKRSHKL
jgi:hypothetical protein